MGTSEGEQKGGRVPYFAFELISKAVILFIFNSGNFKVTLIEDTRGSLPALLGIQNIHQTIKFVKMQPMI